MFGQKRYVQQASTLSSDARSFIAQLLEPQIHSRLTAQQALLHPWMQSQVNFFLEVVVMKDMLIKVDGRILQSMYEFHVTKLSKKKQHLNVDYNKLFQSTRSLILSHLSKLGSTFKNDNTMAPFSSSDSGLESDSDSTLITASVSMSASAEDMSPSHIPTHTHICGFSAPKKKRKAHTHSNRMKSFTLSRVLESVDSLLSSYPIKRSTRYHRHHHDHDHGHGHDHEYEDKHANNDHCHHHCHQQQQQKQKQRQGKENNCIATAKADSDTENGASEDENDSKTHATDLRKNKEQYSHSYANDDYYTHANTNQCMSSPLKPVSSINSQAGIFLFFFFNVTTHKVWSHTQLQGISRARLRAGQSASPGSEPVGNSDHGSNPESASNQKMVMDMSAKTTTISRSCSASIAPLRKRVNHESTKEYATAVGFQAVMPKHKAADRRPSKDEQNMESAMTHTYGRNNLENQTSKAHSGATYYEYLSSRLLQQPSVKVAKNFTSNQTATRKSVVHHRSNEMGSSSKHTNEDNPRALPTLPKRCSPQLFPTQAQQEQVKYKSGVSSQEIDQSSSIEENQNRPDVQDESE
ncbi:cation diffusion facilitator family transporter containing protein [Reticulomyxa filosa]|uniref:Cation diffusion facilitator family transporter containing protein n=1 Tax=Reticulomyxa filosa TaxID=46433 RepID=X6M0X8_RETFI|nr:cation diffusion facilitator family transporter containing protein [Reticulomyxa filosa]|eukprot:ETO06635.1 cation diffusion facilitator family transporter containing protein [Reticulomyxa filosa]